jgi:hypothetical protein
MGSRTYRHQVLRVCQNSAQSALNGRRCRALTVIFGVASLPMDQDELHRRAERYRSIARRVTDPQAIRALEELVATYEARADEAQRALSPPKAEDYEYKD